MKRNMEKLVSLATVLAATLTLAALSSCAYQERTVYTDGTVTTEDGVVVVGAPPAPIVEQTVVAPGPGYVWIDGGWAWTDHWVWRSGYWARPPRPGAVWVPGRYAYHNGAHVYYRGRWRY
jgi:hypothetical protein